MISYDFQAGTYVKNYDEEKQKEHLKRFADFIIENKIEGGILEAGVGEGTTLVPLLKLLGDLFSRIYGFDISWSRVKIARDFLSKNSIQKVDLFVGDMFCMPFKDNSIDLVYTYHAIEPNGGHEKEILEELYRVTKKYLILLEPSYEFAEEKARKRMKKYGYAIGLYREIKNLNYNIEEYSLYGESKNSDNPTGFLVIKKDGIYSDEKETICCPVTKSKLEKYGDAYFSEESLLAYPILGGIPCLTKECAIVATHYTEESDKN